MQVDDIPVAFTPAGGWTGDMSEPKRGERLNWDHVGFTAVLERVD